MRISKKDGRKMANFLQKQSDETEKSVNEITKRATGHFRKNDTAITASFVFLHSLYKMWWHINILLKEKT